MVRNYLTIALRNLRRNLGYTAIHLVGLAVGLAACLLIGLYVRHELSYDDFHENADRIVRAVRASSAGDAFGPTDARRFDGTPRMPPGLAQTLQDRVPSVAQATAVYARSQRLLERGETQLHADQVLHADTSFFEVFSFDLRRGDARSVLDAPGRIVLTDSLARRLFDAENPIGKTVVYENEAEYEVAGVVADPPPTSHLQFDAVRSLTERERQTRYGSTIDWNFYSAYLYLTLSEGSDVRSVERTVRELERAEKPKRRGPETTTRLQPLTQVHLYSSGLSGDIGAQGDVRYLYFFGLIGLLILGLACINYVNLATARAVRRAREVGVRKTVGAGRGQLIGQFLGESVLTATLALPLALGLAGAALPVVNDIVGTTLRLSAVPPAEGGAAALGLVLLVGLAAGSYPALVLSGARPSRVLAGSRSGVLSGGSAWLRKGLVTVQFAASAALILATVVVYLQLRHVQTKNLGFDEERVVTFEKGPLGDQFGAFKEVLRQRAAVTGVSAGPPVGLGRKNMTTTVADAETGEERRVSFMTVDHNYLETMGIAVKRGRTFDPERSGETSQTVVLTEAATRTYGLGENPVGKTIPGVRDREEARVIGVVEDVHNTSLRSPIGPVVFRLAPERTWTAVVRLAPDAAREGLSALRATWTEFLPDRPFTYSFLDQQIEAQYRAERRLATLFGLFAGLAILVAGLGLFGLAAYTVRQRTREVGIRKALGATAANIVTLLSTEFVQLVGLAVLIGLPGAYLALRRWLENFADRVELGAGVFVFTGLVVLLVAVLTAGVQALRAARTDPSVALRDE
jgi:putative ABC transport system permease protein